MNSYIRRRKNPKGSVWLCCLLLCCLVVDWFGAIIRLKQTLNELYALFSKHRPSGPMLSISRFVRLYVCLCVCLSVCSLLRYRLTVFLPPLTEVGCPIFLDIQNPWGKVMERSRLRYEHFCLKIVQNWRAKKSFFLHFFRSSSVFGLF